MFFKKINEQLELRLIQPADGDELFRVVDCNRKYLREWHPWVDIVRSPADMDRFVSAWVQQFFNNRGFYAGIWHEGSLCGVINHLTIDWTNHATILSYWLAESFQGKGIMTLSCRAIIEHAFHTFKLNRVTIECASENRRSRRIPDRLGFKFEGMIRQVEWLHDHYADHAMYGLLKSDLLRNEQMQTDKMLAVAAQ